MIRPKVKTNKKVKTKDNTRYVKDMNKPFTKIKVGKCELYDHRTNVRRARLLIKRMKDLNFDPNTIISAKKDRLGKFMTGLGVKLLEADRKSKDEQEFFANVFGKAMGELFCEAYINCGRYDRFTGISDYIPGFVLGHPDHGVEGQVTYKFPKPRVGTLQCKMTLNHYGDRTMIERNEHKCGNFYEQSVEDYGLDTVPSKERKQYMTFFGNFETNHRNCDGFNFVLKEQLRLVDVDKEFWQEFFDCLIELSKRNDRKRKDNKITLYPSQQHDVIQLMYDGKQDNSSCGGGKSIKMHYLQQEALCK